MFALQNFANAPSKIGKMNEFVINPWGLALVLQEWMAVSHDDLKQHEEWTVSKDNV